jgi:hypothetical protein
VSTSFVAMLVSALAITSCGNDPVAERPRSEATPRTTSNESPASTSQATDTPAKLATPVQQAACELVLGPDRRFRPRFQHDEGSVAVHNLPAISDDGRLVALDDGEPGMDEGDARDTPPIRFGIYATADGRHDQSVVLATGPEQDRSNADAVEGRVREARRLVERLGFQSFRRIRGPLRAYAIDDVLRRFDELEGPCRAQWGVEASATLVVPDGAFIDTLPREDDRCGNMVHDIDAYIAPEHGFVLFALDVGTPADLCESGVGYFAFRYATE